MNHMRSSESIGLGRSNQHPLINGLPAYKPIIYANPEEDSDDDEPLTSPHYNNYTPMAARPHQQQQYPARSTYQEGKPRPPAFNIHVGTAPPQRYPIAQFNEPYPIDRSVRPGSPRGHSHLYPQRSPLENSPYRYEPGSPIGISHGAPASPVHRPGSHVHPGSPIHRSVAPGSPLLMRSMAPGSPGVVHQPVYASGSSSPSFRQIPVQHLDSPPRSPAGPGTPGTSTPKMTPVKVIGSSDSMSPRQPIGSSDSMSPRQPIGSSDYMSPRQPSSPMSPQSYHPSPAAAAAAQYSHQQGAVSNHQNYAPDYGKPYEANPIGATGPVTGRPYSPKPASSVLVRGVRGPGNNIPTTTPVITPQPATLTKTVLSQSMTSTKRPGDLAVMHNKPAGKSKSVKEAEVDALTDLLIRNMEASSDPNYVGVCSKCNEAILDEDTGCTALDQMYHVPCFRCTHCDKYLKGCPFFAVEGKPFCEDCYLATLEKCSVCSKPITDRILRATGKPYHPQCFTCVVCGKSLDGIPFTIDATNQIHCIEDFHKKFAPRCHRCHQPIMPEDNKDETVRIVAMDRSFHIQCYKCEDCGVLLSSEAEGRGCYPLDDHILCKSCNAKRIQAMTSNIGSEL